MGRCVEVIVCGQPGSHRVLSAIGPGLVGLCSHLMDGLWVLSTRSVRNVRNGLWVPRSNSILWSPDSIASLIPNCGRTNGVSGLVLET